MVVEKQLLYVLKSFLSNTDEASGYRIAMEDASVGDVEHRMKQKRWSGWVFWRTHDVFREATVFVERLICRVSSFSGISSLAEKLLRSRKNVMQNTWQTCSLNFDWSAIFSVGSVLSGVSSGFILMYKFLRNRRMAGENVATMWKYFYVCLHTTNFMQGRQL